jgi:hypothetical protein
VTKPCQRKSTAPKLRDAKLQPFRRLPLSYLLPGNHHTEPCMPQPSLVIFVPTTEKLPPREGQVDAGPQHRAAPLRPALYSHRHWRSPSAWKTNHRRGLRKTKTHVRRCSPLSAHHRNSSNHRGLSRPPCTTTDLRRLRRPGARRSSSAPHDVDEVEAQLCCRCSSPFRPARSSLEPSHPSQEQPQC